jgi:hypothetical protein
MRKQIFELSLLLSIGVERLYSIFYLINDFKIQIIDKKIIGRKDKVRSLGVSRNFSSVIRIAI